MKLRMLLAVAPLLFTGLAFGQAADTPFQVSFANNTGLATVKASNSGASSTVASPTQNGALCVNMYVFSATATLQSCCSCLVVANGLASLPVAGSGSAPLVIKLLGSTGAPTCNAGTVGTGANVLATGMLAWVDTAPFASATHVQQAFTPSTLSVAELTALNAKCAAAGQTTCSSCPAPPAI